MKLSVIIIGDEILIGQVTDTNSGAIARTFGPLGWDIASVRTVADNAADIRSAVANALVESELVICTGGLGPTKDDITKHTLAGIFGGKMVRDASVTANIERVFALRGIKMNDLTACQADVPDSCRGDSEPFRHRAYNVVRTRRPCARVDAWRPFRNRRHAAGGGR